MAITLSTHAVEESTYVITVSFTDEDDNAITPITLTWTLVDTKGTVINSREDVVIGTPSSSEDIVLSGDDLQITGSNDNRKRILAVEATYDSDAGSDLPLKQETQFIIDSLVAVS